MGQAMPPGLWELSQAVPPLGQGKAFRARGLTAHGVPPALGSGWTLLMDRQASERSDRTLDVLVENRKHCVCSQQRASCGRRPQGCLGPTHTLALAQAPGMEDGQGPLCRQRPVLC